MLGSIPKVGTQFPYQKRSTASKNIKFIRECVEGSMSLANMEKSNIVASKKNMATNYNLRADILDEKDIEKAINPWGIKGATFPVKMQNYPIANPKIDLLIGEEFKRRFDWKVTVVNPDAISQKEDMIRDTMKKAVADAVVAENYDEAELEKQLQKLQKWSKYEAQDLRERRATHYLQYLWKEQDLKIKFNRGFEDALVAGVEIYNIDIVGGEPVVRKCDPLSITLIGGGSSYLVEDADIIIEDTYQSVRWVIDNYYDYLTSAQIDKLEKGYRGDSGYDDLLNYHVLNTMQNPMRLAGDVSNGEITNYSIIDLDQYSNNNVSAYDEFGNVRVYRVTWVSMRKVGEVKWYDEDNFLQKKLVDENYKVDERLGEKIEWFWINEWWEATRLADDIYVKYGPRPIQFRRMGNKSAGGSGYVGTIYNTNTSSSKSLIDRMKPYQYLYNIFMYRTELAFAKSKGKIGVLDMSRVPDEWDVDKWMYYAEVLGWAAEDPFKESNKGASTGKIAGQMSGSSKVLDLEMGNYIQQHIMMLEFIKQELGEIAGVTLQRQGQIDNRETVGGVERAVTQSSHITEKWFMLHDNCKKRVLEALLETAKYAWRNKSNEKLQFISDEMSQIITEIDGEQFNEADYGIMISNSTDDAELIQAMRQLAQAGLQNDKINFSGLMDIYLSESMSSMRRKIEQYEEEAMQRIEATEQANRESAERIQEMVVQNDQAEREQRYQEKILDSETKITVANINAASGAESGQQSAYNSEDAKLTLEKLKQDWKKFESELKLKKEQLNETIRHNKKTEVISSKKAIQRKK
jgi:hypothetical protein